MSEAIGNITMERKGNKLVITIDTSKTVGRTKKDSGDVIAATGGYVPIEKDGEVVAMFSMHLWKRDPVKKEVKERRSFAL